MKDGTVHVDYEVLVIFIPIEMVEEEVFDCSVLFKNYEYLECSIVTDDFEIVEVVISNENDILKAKDDANEGDITELRLQMLTKPEEVIEIAIVNFQDEQDDNDDDNDDKEVFPWQYIVIPSGIVTILLICIVLTVTFVMVILCVKNRKHGKMMEELKTHDIDVEILLQETKASGNKEKNEIRFEVDSKLFELDYNDIQLVELIGEGASESAVFRAKYNGNDVAFKVFNSRSTLSHDQETFTQFEKELRITASLRHDNLCGFIGACIKKGGDSRIGIVMEFLKGGTLSSMIFLWAALGTKTSTRFDRKLEILKGIVDGMRFLHSKKIVHRDLKCENVLLSDTGVPKIIDFGISKVIESNSSVTMTRRPEVTLSSSYSDKIDVFSFSIIMYEMLFEKVNPFQEMASNEATTSFCFNYELRIAKDENFRPPLDGENIAKEHAWIYALMTKCWKGDPRLRPDFDLIHKELGRNREEEIKTMPKRPTKKRRRRKKPEEKPFVEY